MRNKIISLAIIGLIGCSPKAEQITYPVWPKELSDCIAFRIDDGSSGSIKIVRCPLSATSVTYQQGKTVVSTVVIDGVEYVKKTP